MVSNVPGGSVVSVDELEHDNIIASTNYKYDLIITHQRSNPGEVAALQALPPVLDLRIGHLDALDQREGGGHDELVLGRRHLVQLDEVSVGVLEDTMPQVVLRLVPVAPFIRQGFHAFVDT